MTFAKSHFAIASALALSLPIVAQERKIGRSDLPPAVEKTVQSQSQGATIKGYAAEVEHGKKTYEVEMIVDGRTKDIQIEPDGTVSEIEDEVAFDSLPASVQAGLTKKAAGAKITKVESLTKKGKLVAYEAATLKSTKKGEVQVGPDGNPIAHEE